MQLNQRLSRAIYEKNFVEVASELLASEKATLGTEQEALLNDGIMACANIRDRCVRELDCVSRRFTEAGINHRIDERELEAPQFHQLTVWLEDDDPTTAFRIASDLGYRTHQDLSAVQWEVFRRLENAILLTKMDETTLKLRLRWPGSTPGRFTAPLWPNIADAALLPLAARLWPLSFLVRPVGVAMRRLGTAGGGTPIGEYLGTPGDLIVELLRFAGLTNDDVLLDLGCGDGRVLVEAAKRYSCQAIGYEQDEALCQSARLLASQNDVDDRVEVHCANALSATLENADVVFLFQPLDTVCNWLPSLLEKLPPNGRIVAHEQLRLECELTPCESRPLFGKASLTVAHLWRVSANTKAHKDDGL